MRPFPCHFTGKGRRSLRLGKKKIKSVESLSFRRQQQCNGRVSGAAADRENALLRHRGTSKGASRWPQDGSRPLSERTEGLNRAQERPDPHSTWRTNVRGPAAAPDPAPGSQTRMRSATAPGDSRGGACLAESHAHFWEPGWLGPRRGAGPRQGPHGDWS